MIAFLFLALTSLALTIQTYESDNNKQFSSLVGSQPSLKQLTPSINIYGLRWSLGNLFSLQEQHKNSQVYLLTFNSDKKLQGNISLSIKNVQTPCQYHHFQFNNNTVHIYHCELDITMGDGMFVHRLEKQLSYSLLLSSDITEDFYSSSVERQVSIIVFQSKFRPISYSLSSIFLGHLNLETKILPSLLSRNKDINLLVFTGNFALPLNINNYQSILKALQPISSMITVVLLNLHKIQQISSQLFLKLFYTPMRQIYQSYFWIIKLPKNIVMLAINPILQHTQQLSYSQLQQKFSSQLSNITEIFDQSSYFVIAIAPFFQHLANLSKAVANSTLAAFFNKINVNVYLSSAQTGYFRKILNNDDITIQPSLYSFGYPIIINQGQSSDNVLSQEDYDLYLPSQGLGILSFEGRENSRPISVTYEHINLVTAEVEDHITLNRPYESYQIQADIYIRAVIILAQFAFIILVVGCICCALIKLRGSNSMMASGGHVEMVQQVQHSQRNQLRRADRS